MNVREAFLLSGRLVYLSQLNPQGSVPFCSYSRVSSSLLSPLKLQQVASLHPGMAAAYDGIADAYDTSRSKGNKKDSFEMLNVKSILKPLIQDARVIEFACGSGFYTFELLDWGARSVVAADNSKEMLRLGQDIVDQRQLAGKITFLESDCSKVTSFPGSPFDVAFGAWLLPYAPDSRTLTSMFQNVAHNLKDGGVFVSVTNPPSNDPKATFQSEIYSSPPAQKGGFYRELLHDVEDGICTRVHIPSTQGDNYFDGYRLKLQVYEKAAKAAGLTGEMKWITPSVEACGEAGFDRKLGTDFGILMITK